ncbi:LicD family protein [Erysipelothrix tonsillarum]|uniref:LicD family protein n=1 Tax=Erysipelothrix tonsillarum TaxID=38402 RepID=A0A6S6I1B1_9FIRM|nr:LicD family protein [Erysipelothrix tonsillarum]BCB22762.1 LicD family protein [Erysipelothrix tonsillarum]BCB22783.1 LicD family protein [Erysipelothrix tonsillarum]
MNNIQKDSLSVLKDFHEFCVEHNLKYSTAFGTLLGTIRHKGYIPWDDDIDVVMPWEDYLRFIALASENRTRFDAFFLQNSDTDKNYHNLYVKLRNNNGKEYIENSNSHIKLHRGAWIDIFPAIPTSKDPKEIEQDFYYIDKMIRNIDIMTLVKPSKKDRFIKKTIKSIVFYFNKTIYSHNPLLSFYEKKIRQRLEGMYDKDGHLAVVYTIHLNGNYEEFRNYFLDINMFDNLELRNFEDIKVYCFKEYDFVLTNAYGDYMKIPDEKDRVTHNIIDL